ncbi:MAG: hypothetical protein JWN07_748 [Hyphomicrobiales bacterium]|nr:hypothetical protein [Hyphomicrobiales bacterium]
MTHNGFLAEGLLSADAALSRAPIAAIAPLGDVCSDCTQIVESEHRIATHFALLAGYVSIKRGEMKKIANGAADPLALAAMYSIAAQITVMSGLHRALSADPFADVVDISRYLRDSCEPFRQGISGLVAVSSAFRPGCYVQMNVVLPITQIMVEIITNSLKHAHAAGEPGAIRASCASDRLGNFTLQVIDDGDGLPAAFDATDAKGLGFRIVRALSQKIGATIGYSSAEGGVTFQLSLPAVLPSA